MMNFFDNFDFPSLPENCYSSAPIYFEPMRGSGERLTVAGAVVNETSVLVKRLISPEITEALYGKQGRNFMNLIDYAISEINIQLAQSRSFENLSTPISGIHIGRVTSIYADDVNQALIQIAKLYASLCNTNLLQEEKSTVSIDNTLATWVKQVQNQIVITHPELVNYLNVKIELAHGEKVTVNFATEEKAVNFGLISPTRLSTDSTKVKLWNLENLPDSVGSQERALYLGVSLEGADTRVETQINNRVELLREQAYKNKILVKPVHTVTEIADLLAA